MRDRSMFLYSTQVIWSVDQTQAINSPKVLNSDSS